MAVLVVSGIAYADDAGYMIKGKVVSVDMAAKTVVVDTDQGQKTILFQGAEGLTGAEGACSPNVKPGDNVEISCVDVSGKACGKNIKVIAIAQKTSVFEGEVVSVDPSGKTLVLKNDQGQEMTLRIESSSAEKLTPMPGGTYKVRAGAHDGASARHKGTGGLLRQRGQILRQQGNCRRPRGAGCKGLYGSDRIDRPGWQDDRHQHDRRPENSLLSGVHNRYASD